MPRAARCLSFGLLAAIGLWGCGRDSHAPQAGGLFGAGPSRPQRVPRPNTVAARIVHGAKEEARRGVQYDPTYRVIPYPGGDVPRDRGVCTDVVIRALRAAGYDLQKLIHEDMRRHFALYPRRYGLRRPDRNIDHRRTPNQQVFFARHGTTLPKAITGRAAATWLPGDLVYCRLPNGLGHTGVLSDVRGPSGLPMVLHNMSVAVEEDVLSAWEITGHYRYPPDGAAGRRRRASR